MSTIQLVPLCPNGREPNSSRPFVLGRKARKDKGLNSHQDIVSHYERELSDLDRVTEDNARDLIRRPVFCKSCGHFTEDLNVALDGSMLRVRWTCMGRKGRCRVQNVGDFDLAKAREILQAGLAGAHQRLLSEA